MCGGVGHTLYAALRDRLFTAPGSWNLRQCVNSACQMTWLDPMPVEEDLHLLYPADYYTHQRSGHAGDVDQRTDQLRIDLPNARVVRPAFKRLVKDGAISALYGSHQHGCSGAREQVARALGKCLALVPTLQRSIGEKVLWVSKMPGDQTLLDVGCGNGRFLNEMRRGGWNVVGVEPDETAVRAARSAHGLEVYHGVLEQVELPANTFDVITMGHVIEHLFDPIRTLRVARSLLKPGGRLMVLTPNASGWGSRRFREDWVGWDPPRHLFIFTPHSLAAAVQSAGFDDICVRTSGRQAPWVWQVSRTIQRQGSCPGGEPPSKKIYRWSGRVARFGENTLQRFAAVGEELQLTAARAAS